MGLRYLFLFTFFLLNAIAVNAKIVKKNPIKIIPKVIYGTDDREDVYLSSDNLMKELSKSTAAQIQNAYITQKNDVYTLDARILTGTGICKSERFSNQMAAANCSGFLVAPDVLVTAGHCVTSMNDCENQSWIFDYANITEEKTSFSFNKDQVFHCVKIIEREKDSVTLNDFSVIKLDRAVPNRTPLKFRTDGKTADDAVFTVLGHPSGLPLKITSGADMRDNSNAIFFRTNADTYGGNSGSAVVDSRTGIVEGILVRGDQDYERSEAESCSVSVHRDQNGGRGEDITRITNIKKLPKRETTTDEIE